VDVIGSDYVIENGQAIPYTCQNQPKAPSCSITLELQKKIAVMAAVRNVPYISGHVSSLGSGHEFLKSTIFTLKCAV
jgi:hypothetical protein